MSGVSVQVPGRSDNEIKNFWHKKRKSESLTIYQTPPEKKLKQSPTNVIDNHNHISINYPNQFQPFAPNIVNSASHLPTDSPHTMISTTRQPQFLSSPRQSPTGHFSHQTTPASQTPKLLFPSSPNQTSADRLRPSSSCHFAGASSISFTSLGKPPPVVSSPNHPLRQSRVQSSSALEGHYISGSAMESPGSPQRSKLSSGIPAPYSVPMSTQTMVGQLCLLPGLELNSPSTAPLSPLNLLLSFPASSESCFGSNLSITDPMVQLNLVSSQRLEPSDQFHPLETPGVNSCMDEVECESYLEIMEELKKAQARVRFLKKKLKQSSRIKHLRSHESPETTDLLTEVAFDGYSSQSATKDYALSQTNPRTENLVDGEARVDTRPHKLRKKDLVKRITKLKGGQVKKARQVYRDNLDGGEYEQGSRDSQTFQDLNSQNNVYAPNLESWDDQLCTLQRLAGEGEYPFMEGFFSESSTFFQDGFLKGDLFGQLSTVEDTFSSQRHEPPTDALGQFCGQSSATTLVKPGDESGLSSYLQADYFGFPEHGLMDGNMAANSLLCEAQLSMHQNPAADCLLESQHCEPSFVQHQSHTVDRDSVYRALVPESLPGVQFSLQTSGHGNSYGTSKFCESGFLLHQAPEARPVDSRHLVGFEPQEPFGEQNLIEGVLADNLWTKNQMVSQDRHFQRTRDSITLNWNNESPSGHMGSFF